MALREYEWRGQTWQFDEDAAPADAVPVEGVEGEASDDVAEDAAPADAVPVEGEASDDVAEDAAPADAVPVEGSGDAAPAPKRSQARNKAAKPADK